MIDLGSVHLITDRPGATPAPTPQPRPSDEATYRAWLGSLTTDEFIAEIERGTGEVLAVAARHRALGEVA